MTDEAWKALAVILPSLFALLAALFAKQTKDLAHVTAEKLEQHEEASAERGRILRAEVAPGRRNLND